ncbi:hypothetical protein ASG72_01735 [Bosea sp. Leaf344]|nr:hypothetical protein ASG72_01735 [Bosea sp. Leaf344]
MEGGMIGGLDRPRAVRASSREAGQRVSPHSVPGSLAAGMLWETEPARRRSPAWRLSDIE